MPELANDERNPCVGCGPTDPRGLRLAFAREEGHVVAHMSVRDELRGWPGRLHSGILYLALLETANWTVFGLTGKVGFPLRTSALEVRGWVPVGSTLTLTGGLVQRSAPVRVRARASVGGEPVASLERDFDFPSPDEAARRLGYEALPAVLEGFFEP